MCKYLLCFFFFFFQAEDGIRDAQESRGLGDVYKRQGVGSVIYTSGLGADVVDEGVLGEHHATEAVLADSGLPYTILRHPIYSDFFINPTLQAAMEVGEITSSTGGRGLNTGTRADLAEAAAVVLTSTGQEDKAYDFTGRLWQPRVLSRGRSRRGHHRHARNRTAHPIRRVRTANRRPGAGPRAAADEPVGRR